MEGETENEKLRREGANLRRENLELKSKLENFSLKYNNLIKENRKLKNNNVIYKQKLIEVNSIYTNLKSEVSKNGASQTLENEGDPSVARECMNEEKTKKKISSKENTYINQRTKTFEVIEDIKKSLTLPINFNVEEELKKININNRLPTLTLIKQGGDGVQSSTNEVEDSAQCNNYRTVVFDNLEKLVFCGLNKEDYNFRPACVMEIGKNLQFLDKLEKNINKISLMFYFEKGRMLSILKNYSSNTIDFYERLKEYNLIKDKYDPKLMRNNNISHLTKYITFYELMLKYPQLKYSNLSYTWYRSNFSIIFKKIKERGNLFAEDDYLEFIQDKFKNQNIVIEEIEDEVSVFDDDEISPENLKSAPVINIPKKVKPKKVKKPKKTEDVCLEHGSVPLRHKEKIKEEKVAGRGYRITLAELQLKDKNYKRQLPKTIYLNNTMDDSSIKDDDTIASTIEDGDEASTIESLNFNEVSDNDSILGDETLNSNEANASSIDESSENESELIVF